MAVRDSIDNILERTRQAIDTISSDPALAAGMARHGYSTERMSSTRTLYQQALTLNAQQDAAYDTQRKATEALEQLRKRIDTTYMQHIKLARVAFRADESRQTLLQLSGSRKKDREGWIGQVRDFYTNAVANPEIIAAFESLGIGEATLREGQALVDQIAAANDARDRAKSEAQRATIARDDVLRQLMAWYRDVVAVARVAFANDPQQLEKMGITMR